MRWRWLAGERSQPSDRSSSSPSASIAAGRSQLVARCTVHARRSAVHPLRRPLRHSLCSRASRLRSIRSPCSEVFPRSSRSQASWPFAARNPSTVDHRCGHDERFMLGMLHGDCVIAAADERWSRRVWSLGWRWLRMHGQGAPSFRLFATGSRDEWKSSPTLPPTRGRRTP
jgi:hypothetical protein